MIDLRTCKKGDLLVSKHGSILEYVAPLPDGNLYDHEVMYPDGSGGTRLHDGYTFRNPERRLPTDHDIIAIIDNN